LHLALLLVREPPGDNEYTVIKYALILTYLQQMQMEWNIAIISVTFYNV